MASSMEKTYNMQYGYCTASKNNNKYINLELNLLDPVGPPALAPARKLTCAKQIQ